VRRYAVTYFRFFLSRSCAFQVVFREMFGIGEAYFQRIKARLAEILRRSVPGLSPGEAEVNALAILGILNMVLLERMLAGRKVQVRQALDQITKVYLSGLKNRATVSAVQG
jgi:hypothetical protein